MTLPWSSQQREWLQALGHPVMILAGDGSVAGNVEPAAVTAPDAATASSGAPVQAPVQADDSPLHRALLKATGLPVDQAEQALTSMAVNTAALRDDPAAKRALWSSLRRLRTGQPR